MFPQHWAIAGSLTSGHRCPQSWVSPLATGGAGSNDLPAQCLVISVSRVLPLSPPPTSQAGYPSGLLADLGPPQPCRILEAPCPFLPVPHTLCPQPSLENQISPFQPSHMAGGHVKWGSHFGKIWQVLKTLNIVAI